VKPHSPTRIIAKDRCKPRAGYSSSSPFSLGVAPRRRADGLPEVARKELNYDGDVSPWSTFDEQLHLQCDEQAWDDHFVLAAVDALAAFSAGDWAVLVATWSARGTPWQHRCASALADGAPEHAIPLLVAMIDRAPSDHLALRAADSLRTRLGASPEGVSIAVPPSVAARIESMRAKATGLLRASLTTLLDVLDGRR
jgi:hypothetical protein